MRLALTLAMALAVIATLLSARALGQTANTPMVTIPAGSFVMGSDDGPADERPAHWVILPEFRIDVRPVTTMEFAVFLNAVGPRNAAGQNLFDVDDSDARIGWDGQQYVALAGYENHPAVEPSWAGARDYCRWRGARLPTEAEWERAARGPEGRTYPWGEAAPDTSRARFGARFNDYLALGSFPAGATPDGVEDLAGNVWQWVSSLCGLSRNSMTADHSIENRFLFI